MLWYVFKCNGSIEKSSMVSDVFVICFVVHIIKFKK
jgi:hypothetical protein